MMNNMRTEIPLLLMLPVLLACGSPSHTVKVEDPAARAQELLDTMLERSLNRLGQPGSLAGNSSLNISLPDELARAAKSLRRYGLDRPLEELHNNLNRAGEAMIPAAKSVLQQSVPECFTTHPALLAAGNEAITRRLRAQCHDLFSERLRPVVAESLQRQQVTAGYRRLSKRLSVLDRSHDWQRIDLEAWLTRGVLEAIYATLAEEERRARRAAGGR